MVYDLEIELRIGRVLDSSVAVEISSILFGRGGGLARKLRDAPITTICKNGCHLWPVHARASSRPPKLLVIDGLGAHNGNDL